MRRSVGFAVALFMIGAGLTAPNRVEAAGDPGGFFDGQIAYSQIYNCISIIQGAPYVEYGAGAYVGAYADPDESPPVPGVNQTFYMRVAVYGLGNACSGQRFVPAIDLPANVQLDTTVPILCYFGSTQTSSPGDCPQWGSGNVVSPSVYGGDFMYLSTDSANAKTWPLPAGGSWEFRFPVKSTTTQTSAPLGAFVKMFDGNSSPTLTPTSPLYVFAGTSAPSILYDQPSTMAGPFIPGTSIVPKWGIYSTANIFTGGLAGTGRFEIGTSPGNFSQSVSFPLPTPGSWAVSNDWDEPTITALVPGQTYYWRAAFTPSGGSTIYGAQQSFTRPVSPTPPPGPLPPPPVPPVVFPPPPPPTPTPPGPPAVVPPASSGFSSLTPARLLDSRGEGVTTDGQFVALGRRAAGSVTEVVVQGRGGVSGSASAVSLNVTAAGAAERGFLTVYPCGVAVPGASSLNYQAGVNLANAVISKVGAGGKVCVFTKSAIDLIIDVNGAFAV